MNIKEVKQHLKTASETIRTLDKDIKDKEQKIAEVRKENDELATKNAELSDKNKKLAKEISAMKKVAQLVDDDIIDPLKTNYWIEQMMKSAGTPEEFGEQVKALHSPNETGEEIGEEDKDDGKEEKKKEASYVNPAEAIAKKIMDNHR